MTDRLARLLAALDDPEPEPRTPDRNNPYRAAYVRPRRGKPTYRDPTANRAVGAVDRERKVKT